MTHTHRLFSCLVALSLAPLFLPMTARAQSNAPLLTTFANPTPAHSDYFGSGVAALGSDRVLIGTDNADASLFSLDGTLLRTFTVADPSAGGFGNPVLGVGNDRVLISAYSYGTTAQNGRAYLFRTNGALQTTFTNPATATVQAFGLAIASMGNDRVLIGGLPDFNKPAPYPGGVFLFRTNGTLLASFLNPTPAVHGSFGLSIAAVGNDFVLIGAPGDNTGAPQSGVAHLFNTNGVRLLTFTNPVPRESDNFGTAVSAVGNNRVLISAIDFGNAGNGGVAYLFNTNGALITTFTNPNHATSEGSGSEHFGWSVAAVGSTRVLIGANQDDNSAINVGSAYLFSTNGTLLNTFTNPTPAAFDNFGWSVAAVGPDRVVVGALFDDLGATDSGVAHLFALPYPALRMTRSTNTVSVRWITAETGLLLQQTDALGTPTVWSNTTNSISINGPTNVLQQSTAGGTTNRFYRLRRP